MKLKNQIQQYQPGKRNEEKVNDDIDFVVGNFEHSCETHQKLSENQ
jgi:hypothetical protein